MAYLAYWPSYQAKEKRRSGIQIVCLALGLIGLIIGVIWFSHAVVDDFPAVVSATNVPGVVCIFSVAFIIFGMVPSPTEPDPEFRSSVYDIAHSPKKASEPRRKKTLEVKSRSYIPNKIWSEDDFDWMRRNGFRILSDEED